MILQTETGPHRASDHIKCNVNKFEQADLYYNKGMDMRCWFIGIGGVGMGSLACCLKEQGHDVRGSDAGVYPPMSDYLERAGIDCCEGFDAQRLLDWAQSPNTKGEAPFRSRPLVVVGNAVPRGNVELEAALDARIELSSLPELIGAQFLPGTHPVVVSGTHGKTTTTNLVALLFQRAGLRPGWMIGGVPADLPRSMRAAGDPLIDADGSLMAPPFVIEGDEYDTAFYDKRSKFFHYWPRTLLINHLEYDHADIFDDLEQIRTAFRRLVNMVPAGVRILANGDCEDVRLVCADSFCPVILFGESEDCAYRLLEEAAGERESRFTASVPQDPGWIRELAGAGLPGERVSAGPSPKGGKRGSRRGTGPLAPLTSSSVSFSSPLQGVYNGRNLLAALASADLFAVPRELALEVFQSFSGPARRMDRYELGGGILLFDDFGHHPTAVRESITSLRRRNPGRRLTVLHEPRSNSSVTRVMQKEWQEALALADRVIMGPLHRPWKYAPEELFDLERAAAWFAGCGVDFAQVDDVSRIPGLLAEESDSTGKDGAAQLWAIFSNGGFGGLRDMLVERFGS